jgi:hypothetical protein
LLEIPVFLYHLQNTTTEIRVANLTLREQQADYRSHSLIGAGVSKNWLSTEIQFN